MNDNQICVSGIITKPVYDVDAQLYSTDIYIQRDSGAVDVIPVLMQNDTDETQVLIRGEFRSHNTPERKLKLYIYAQEITPYVSKWDINEVQLTGYVCKKPVARTTPRGRTITDVLLAVNRSNIADRSDYIPVVTWKDNSTLEIGDQIMVRGRVQSRTHRKGVAYEISTQELRTTLS